MVIFALSDNGKVKIGRCLIFLFWVVFLPLGAATKVVLFDTPTALSMERGEYSVDTYFFKDGGILLKSGAGINKHVNLGVIAYVYRLIGFGQKVGFQIPNVYGHFRATAEGDESINFAMGYNSMYNGSFSPFRLPSYGFYAVMTTGFPRQTVFLESPHFFSFGLRLPVFHQFAEPDLFVSFHLRFTPVFEFATEMSNMHFRKQYEYYFINNNVFIFNIFDKASVNVALQVAGKVKEHRKPGTIPLVGVALYLKFKGFF